MSSQIPFTPVTLAALAKLTGQERSAFVTATELVVRDEKPPLALAAELVTTIQRLITAGTDAEGGSAPDLRPREGEPGWHDATCGSCGEEFGTNFRVEEIECAACEARRCPSCGSWFGEDHG